MKFFTDGIKTIKLNEGDPIPSGFYPGRTFNAKPWNKGLTKTDDPRIAQNIEHMRETRIKNKSFNSWNKGLTKETSESLRIVAEKISAATQGRTAWNKGKKASEQQKKLQSEAMKGHIPWNKGLTKDINDSLKSSSVKLTGHECYVKDWDSAKLKAYNTKKQNKSFNTSKPEAELINYLINKYGEDDIIHPYRDDRYPYNCDAYIKSLDLFIELNATFEHNTHPYNPNDPSDVREADNLRIKAEKLSNNNRYWNALKWWTEIDPQKLETFRKNKLNFCIIYPNNLIIKN